MSRFQAIGSFVYEKGERIESAEDLARKLNAYQMRIERLKAEVERLRKAGDALYESEIGYYGEQILVDPKHHNGELCRNWNAAKEGKPSA